MLLNTFRYVRYLDDGHEEFQCMECYKLIPVAHIGYYCCRCGTRFNTKLECRNQYTPRYEYEHPNLDFSIKYPLYEDQIGFRLTPQGGIYKTAKDAYSSALYFSELRFEPIKIYYGRKDYNPTKYILVDYHTRLNGGTLQECMKKHGFIENPQHKGFYSKEPTENIYDALYIGGWESYYKALEKNFKQDFDYGDD